MERTAWTDERLDDLSKTMNSRFDRVDGDIRELRTEVRTLRTELRDEFHNEIGGLRVELGGRIDRLEARMVQFTGGLTIAVIASIAANLLQG